MNKPGAIICPKCNRKLEYDIDWIPGILSLGIGLAADLAAGRVKCHCRVR